MHNSWSWRTRRTRARTPALLFLLPSCGSLFLSNVKELSKCLHLLPFAQDGHGCAAEKLAYVAMVNGNDNGRHDAMGVVDVDPGSSGYGHLVGQVDWMSSAYHPGHSCFTSRRSRVATVFQTADTPWQPGNA